jgi:acetyl esterase/lipase
MVDVSGPTTLRAGEAAPMNPLRSVLLTLLALVLAVPARADETKPARAEKLCDVEVVKDLSYNEARDADPDKHKLDLYLPKGRKDFPVLFFVHGDTWKFGDRKQYPTLGETFAARGVGTVVISYRLSVGNPPKVQHPAHIQDVAKAFAWTCTHIGKYGGRADQIFCCGHSAGGHLVSLLATDESYLKAEKHSFADIRGVISMSGVYTIFPVGPIASAFGKDPEVCKKASPIFNVGDKKHPPFLLVYADADYPLLGYMAEKMCDKLKEHKCEASALKVADRSHVSIIVKTATEPDDPTRQAVLDFIKDHTQKK